MCRSQSLSWRMLLHRSRSLFQTRLYRLHPCNRTSCIHAVFFEKKQFLAIIWNKYCIQFHTAKENTRIHKLSQLSANRLMTKARSYEKKGEYALARDVYTKVLENFPNNEKAKKAFLKIVNNGTNLTELDPPKNIMDRLDDLFNKCYYEDCLKLAEQLVQQYPKSSHVWNFIGVSNHNLDNIEKAEWAVSKAIALKPEAANLYNNQGNIVRSAGRVDDAIKLYQRAIELKPDKAGYHYNLSVNKKFITDDPHIEQITNLLSKSGISDNDKYYFHFALAKAFKDIGKYEEAFQSLTQGNAIRKKILHYDINSDVRLFEKIKKTTVSIEQLTVDIPDEKNTPVPIFIVGMPRSGTSLVEQIITSHLEVAGAGELNFIGRLAALIVNESIQLNSENILDMRTRYLAELRKISVNRNYITDKAPQNFRFLHLIYTAFPESRVIHVKRDPAAVCWSNFNHLFTSNDLGYSHDLDDVVQYYKLYDDLMQFWSERYGEKIYTLDYEKLVTNQESETRKLIDYLGLGWDERCLEPEKNERSVRTASQEQVRKKVYSGSQQQWRKFEPFMNGAFDTLGS